MSITERLHDPSSASVKPSSNASDTKTSSTKSDYSTQSTSPEVPSAACGEENKRPDEHSVDNGSKTIKDTIYTSTTCGSKAEREAAMVRQSVADFEAIIDACTAKINRAARNGEQVNWAEMLYEHSTRLCAESNMKSLLSKEDCEHIWKVNDTGLDAAFSEAAKISQETIPTVHSCGDAQGITNISVSNKEAGKAAQAFILANKQINAKLTAKAESESDLTSLGRGHGTYCKEGEPHQLFWAPGWIADRVERTTGESRESSKAFMNIYL